MIQPLDVYGFRIWKNLVRKISNLVLLFNYDVQLNARNNVINYSLSRQNHLSLYPSQFLYLSVSLFLLLISTTRQPEHSLTADGLLIYLSRHYTYIFFHRTPHIHSLTHSCSRDRPECSIIQSSSLSTTFAEIIRIYCIASILNSSIKLHCSHQNLSSLYTQSQ